MNLVTRLKSFRYGNHPVYFEHRSTGTHAVLLLNSNGMDIKLTQGALEYNVIGGVLDFYFLAGSQTDPTQAAKQYAEIVGTPAEVLSPFTRAKLPLTLFRSHTGRSVFTSAALDITVSFLNASHGKFSDIFFSGYIDVAGVISNYSAAKIPLETMWTDIVRPPLHPAILHVSHPS
jgi:alpha-glucosidase